MIAFGFPPPQPGRRSSSSGPRRADDEQRHARRPSRRGSRRSRAARRRPSGGPRTRARGPLLGERLEEAPPGGEAPRRAISPPSPPVEADERSQVPIDPRPLVRSSRVPSSAAGASPRPRLAAVGLEDARLRLHDLAERPVRDARRRTAASVPGASDELGRRRRRSRRARRRGGSSRSPARRRASRAAACAPRGPARARS